ncbi:MAG: GNAT family N-acetyltransferase [Lysobacter sp.]|nr:GNAT family N-acetyltransferase [Lysobacter sp.]
MHADALPLRDATAADHPAILALNRRYVELLSPLDAVRLSRLASQAAYLRVVDEGDRVAAFLLAFREGADYDSPNYLWFAARHPRFLYVDRVVVDGATQGRGLGATLYRDLFDFAAVQGVDTIACEYYSKPPNEASRRFHARFGFREVGRQWLPDARKEVSLQIALGNKSNT